MPTVTLTRPEFSFLSVALVREPESVEGTVTDLLTWRQWIATALTRDHGLLGSSVHVDILHQEPAQQGRDEKVLIRVAKVDRKMAWNSISGWSDETRGLAMRVIQVSDHLTALM